MVSSRVLTWPARRGLALGVYDGTIGRAQGTKVVAQQGAFNNQGLYTFWIECKKEWRFGIPFTSEQTEEVLMPNSGNKSYQGFGRNTYGQPGTDGLCLKFNVDCDESAQTYVNGLDPTVTWQN